MTHQVTLHYDEQLLRRVALSFWWRVVGLPFLVFLVLATVWVVVLIADGDRSWMVGSLATVLAFGIAVVVAIYVVHYRNIMTKFRAMRDAEATFAASGDSFSVSSDLGSTTLGWNTITEVWRFPAFWLLFFSRAQFSTLPLADLTPELKELILERVQAAGGRIR
jgi:hypothetical protein